MVDPITTALDDLYHGLKSIGASIHTARTRPALSDAVLSGADTLLGACEMLVSNARQHYTASLTPAEPEAPNHPLPGEDSPRQHAQLRRLSETLASTPAPVESSWPHQARST